MATHSSIFAWEISRTEELSGLQSMGLSGQRVRHNGATNTLSHYVIVDIVYYVLGFAGGSVVKESTCQCRRHKRQANPWIRKSPWRWK